MSAQSQLIPGQVVGDYRIDRMLVDDGLGVGCAATRLRDGREVFLRVLPGGSKVAPDLAERFAKEARILSIVRHPALPEVLDLGLFPDGTAFVANEPRAGESLRQRLGRQGGLGQPETLRLCAALAEALAQCHQEGLPCAVLTPERVLLQRIPRGEKVQILDVGVAKLLDLSALPAGPYLAPEQARAPLSLAADVYALGLMMEEMLTGISPEAGGGEIDDPMISEDLVALIQRMRSETPEKRPSMGEVAEEISLLRSSDGRAAAPGGLSRAVTKALAIVRLAPSSSPDAKDEDEPRGAPRRPGQATQAWAQIVVERRQMERRRAREGRRTGVTPQRMAVALIAIAIVGLFGLLGIVVSRRVKGAREAPPAQVVQSAPAEVEKDKVQEDRPGSVKEARPARTGPQKDIRRIPKPKRKR